MRYGRLACGALALLLLVLPASARAECDPAVAAGTTLSRTGCQYINFQRCHWEVEYNNCLDKLEAALSQVGFTFPAVTETNWDDYDFFQAPAGLTLIRASCYCQGTCTDPTAAVSFTDRAGNAISFSGGGSLACDKGTGAQTWKLFSTGDADATLVAGEGVRAFFASPTTTDDITVLLQW